jgi:hypothetical protein
MARPKRKLTWHEAWQQAQAEMNSPQAVVWLGLETAAAIRHTPPEAAMTAPVCGAEVRPRPQRIMTSILVATACVLPLALSYRRAYRQMVHIISIQS